MCNEGHDMYVLVMKDCESLYYGNLARPFCIFKNLDEANHFIEKKRLGKIWHAVRASQDLVSRYFGTSF